MDRDDARLVIDLPPEIDSASGRITVAAMPPDTLFQSLLCGLRMRAFDYLYTIPRGGRDEDVTVADAIQATFDEMRHPLPGRVFDAFKVEMPRWVASTDIYPCTASVASLDLSEVSPNAIMALVVDGLRCACVQRR